MLWGCGRIGDMLGDPLAWVTREWIVFIGDDDEEIKAYWQAEPAPHLSSEWYAYNAGVNVSRNALNPHTFTPATPGVVPILAVLPIGLGVGDDSYDPLGGVLAANLVTLKVRFEHKLRGLYRMENTAIELYELYIGTDGEPDINAAPAVTSATLPFDSPVLAVGHTYKFVVRKRNRHNLVSQNVDSTTFVIDGSGAAVYAPSAPSEQTITQAAAGAALISAKYDYMVDAVGVRGDQWAVWITTDGSAPNTAAAPTYTETIQFNDADAKLDYTSSGTAHGNTIKAIVRVRRTGTPNVDSTNTTVMQVTADANGPSAPANAQTFLGQAARQI